MTVIGDYDYITNVFDYDYIAFERNNYDYNYDYLISYNRLQSITNTLHLTEIIMITITIT